MNENEFLASGLMGFIKTKSLRTNQLDTEVWLDVAYKNKDGIVCFVDQWNPLENISQAFEVVEKMVELGWYYELGLAQSEGHECLFFMRDIESSYRAEHKNPATAITLAAAKALRKGER